MEYIRNAHSVYLLTYHIVFVTKYRRPVIDGRISAFLKDHISYLPVQLPTWVAVILGHMSLFCASMALHAVCISQQGKSL